MAQAVWGMAGSLCPDRTRASIAVAAALALLLLPSAVTQIAVILAGAAAGAALCGDVTPPREATLGFSVTPGSGVAALLLFALLLAGLPLLAAGGPHWLALAEACYRAGALVFGGGHVVLPLLERAFVPQGWISAGDFLAGYGVAQAVPGPLFTFAAFLGAAQVPLPNGTAGAAVALAAFSALVLWKAPVWAVVAATTAAGVVAFSG